MTIFRRGPRAVLCILAVLAGLSAAAATPAAADPAPYPGPETGPLPEPAPAPVIDICAEADAVPQGRWGRIERPMRMQRVRFEGQIWILAEGEITPASPALLRSAIATGDAPPRGVILRSRGGRLQAGLEMGRIIRAAGLETLAGNAPCEDGAEGQAPSRNRAPGLPSLPGLQPDSGLCASACAYAFLGGVQRGSRPGALGFHRISSRAPLAMDVRDVAAAEARMLRALVLYVLEMGAEVELIGLAQITPAASLARPGRAELTRLGIVTDAPRQQLATDPGQIRQLSAL